MGEVCSYGFVTAVDPRSGWLEVEPWAAVKVLEVLEERGLGARVKAVLPIQRGEGEVQARQIQLGCFR